MSLYSELEKCGMTEADLMGASVEKIRFTNNSADVKAGDAFVAISGVNSDGHAFITDAISNGAVLILCENTDWTVQFPDTGYIMLKSTKAAWAYICNYKNGNPCKNMSLVAVTGTNGKTSVTYLLREIFESAGFKTGVIGTVRCLSGNGTDVISDSPESSVNSMTTPEPEKLYPELAKMNAEGVEIVFMEASSHSLVQERLAPLKFVLGIFTNLTEDHLDYHPDMENYYLAKKKLFSQCDAAVINVDDEYGKRLSGEIPCPVITCSTKPDSSRKSFFADCIEFCGDGCVKFTVREGGKCFTLCPNIPGKAAMYNSLEAAAVARLFAIPPEIIVKAIKTCPQITGRMEKIASFENYGFDIYIDFAHSPDSLKNALDALKKTKHRRLIVLFGCGGNRDRKKRSMMGKIASENADISVITADNSRNEKLSGIIRDILSGISTEKNFVVIPDREEAIRTVIRSRREGDVILLAGKGHEDYEINSSGKHHFSEREIVFDELGRINSQNY